METEKTTLRAFCRELLQFLQSQMPDPSLDEVGRAIDGSTSLTGLKTITGDLLEWTQDVRGEQLIALDDRLTGHGLPTLAKMRSADYRRFADLLARGQLSTDDEARFVEARLSDVGTTAPSTDERQTANRLLSAYRR